MNMKSNSLSDYGDAVKETKILSKIQEIHEKLYILNETCDILAKNLHPILVPEYQTDVCVDKACGVPESSQVFDDLQSINSKILGIDTYLKTILSRIEL